MATSPRRSLVSRAGAAARKVVRRAEDTETPTKATTKAPAKKAPAKKAPAKTAPARKTAAKKPAATRTARKKAHARAAT